MPANAGIHPPGIETDWIPASAGMTYAAAGDRISQVSELLRCGPADYNPHPESGVPPTPGRPVTLGKTKDAYPGTEGCLPGISSVSSISPALIPSGCGIKL
jgi:hypothetical protein